jgi:hypothetical protein
MQPHCRHLYELLTGRTPFDPKELLRLGLNEMRRIIREREPVRPSTRLTQELARPAVERRCSQAMPTWTYRRTGD